jgi:hypothetical protein
MHAARTRFSVDGYGARRTGSFLGKTGPTLVLTVNPKWLRMSELRSFSVMALARSFTRSSSRKFDVQGNP